MAQDKAAADKLKAQKAEAKRARRAASKERRKQMWQAFQMQRKEDKRLIPYMVGVIVLAIAAFTGLCLFVIWRIFRTGYRLRD